jgi:sorbitol-specific phosphotransferase system component IIBC
MGDVIGFFIFASFVAAWLTHVITCLASASWGFLIAGALCFPVGIVHGIGIWFGAW